MSKQHFKQVSPLTWIYVDEPKTMNNKKQSSVEWFAEMVSKMGYVSVEILEQAKAMQKQQSITDYCEGFKASGEGWNGEYGLTDMLNVAEEINAEQYYNETFGGQDNE